MIEPTAACNLSFDKLAGNIGGGGRYNSLLHFLGGYWGPGDCVLPRQALYLQICEGVGAGGDDDVAAPGQPAAQQRLCQLQRAQHLLRAAARAERAEARHPRDLVQPVQQEQQPAARRVQLDFRHDVRVGRDLHLP